MNTITLDNILPRAFTIGVDHPSDIWGCVRHFSRGERVRVEASSGSGKTTLCAFLMGLRNDFTGNLLCDGVSTSTFSPDHWSRLRRDSLAWLPQEIGLFPQLSLRENIVLKNSLTGFRSELWISESCDRLGIGDCLDRPAARMSVGQQQRGAIVRALCQPADFLILDEPVSHLDAGWNSAVAELIDQDLKASGAGLIVTSVGQHLDIEIDKCLSL